MLERNAPTINLSAKAPETELEAAKHIDSLIDDLSTYIGELLSAVTLFKTIRQQAKNPAPGEAGLLAAWMTVPARDGAVTIYNFAECMQGIKYVIHQNAGIKEMFDLTRIRSLSAEFRKSLPSYDKLRHGVAHAADSVSTPDKARVQGKTGEYAGLGYSQNYARNAQIRNHLHDDTFALTHSGEVRSYDVTEDTVNVLRRARDQLIEAFIEPTG